jgi:hypothetical protein
MADQEAIGMHQGIDRWRYEEYKWKRRLDA